MQCAYAVFFFVICDLCLALLYFPLDLMNRPIFGKKLPEYKTCVIINKG